MAKPAADRIEKKIRSVFPDGSIARVEVLEYGDDPGIEPGETAVRVLISRSGRPEGEEASKEILETFHKANGPVMRKLREQLPRLIEWVEFRPDSAEAGPCGPLAIRVGRGPAETLDDLSEELTAVMTRLGSADLATVDTLITAGIASSRAEVLRWAVGRIRENPAYAQLQERVHEITELKAQF